MQIVRYIGRFALDRLHALYGAWRIAFLVLRGVILRFNQGRSATQSVLFRQIYFTGLEAIPIVSWIALILGLVVVTQSLNILPKIGREALVGEILVWVIVRELGPVFASIIVIARSGTAIAAELGNMKIHREVASLEIMGIDPIQYLVMPRVLGIAISVFVLTFYFEAVSIFGGYLLAGPGKNMSFAAYLSSLLEAMGFVEVYVSLLKSLLFGLLIGSVSCYHGLAVERSITQIPRETTKAVIASLGLVFFLDAVITFAFYL